MRILHVMAGAKNGGSEAVMLDSVLALCEAGAAQHVVTRDDDPMRLRALNAANIPYTIADFDKFVRAPTIARLRAVVRAFEPDVLHYWLARAAIFAEPKWRDISVGWHAGRHRLAHFKNCAWHAIAAAELGARLTAHGVAQNHVAVLAPFNSKAAPSTEPALMSDDDFAQRSSSAEHYVNTKHMTKGAFVRDAMALYEQVRASARLYPSDA